MDESGGRDAPELRLVPRAGQPELSDEALLSDFLQGDDGAFGQLCLRHERLVLSIVRRYARSPDDARDLAQRTFLRALQAVRRTVRRGRGRVVGAAGAGGRGRGATGMVFKSWLVRIAVNLAKNHARDEARAPRAALSALGAAEAREPDAPAVLLRRERELRLRRAVLALPRRQREVLTLRVDAELPFAEIALALGTSENAAKVNFHHATRALRALLAEEDRP